MKVWMCRNTIYRKIMCPVKFCSSKPVWKFMSDSWFRNGGSFFCWSTALSAIWSNVYCPAIVCHIIRLFATGGYAEHNAGKITENYIRLSFRHSFTFSPIQYIVFGWSLNCKPTRPVSSTHTVYLSSFHLLPNGVIIPPHHNTIYKCRLFCHASH